MMQAMLQQQPQSSKSSRELYVGNLPAGNVVNELSLKDFISTAVMQAGLNIQPGNPVMQARINGCYAFIEFRNVQECTNCLSLRGIVLYNNELTVDRPMAYRGAPDGIVITWPTVMAAKLAENPELEAEAIGLRSAAQAAAAMTGVMPAAPAAPQMLGGMLPGMAALPGAVDPATKPARELHIGNIPEGTQELEMRMHLESVVLAAGLRDDSFGPGPVVTAVRCSLKFAFAEFRSVEETSRMMALDGSLFKGMSLRVQRPRAYVAPFGQAPVAPLQMAQVGGYGGGGFSAEGSFPAIGGLPSVGLPPPPPPPEGFDYPIAPPMQMQQPQQPVAPATCLLELSNMCTAAEVQSQQEAFESLQGRTFDGRIVGVRYIAEHEFDARAAAEHQ
ncbi:hypothetical protein T492DRAFT_1030022 [Pavlovales sp. CCMP2436]|nr:hypothetical protein T492DRAFT_1030022 [Pavlovales sp. CCMP2436]